jgi:hypothetical protein
MAEIRKGSEETARASNPMKDETFKPVADSKVSFISSRVVFQRMNIPYRATSVCGISFQIPCLQ